MVSPWISFCGRDLLWHLAACSHDLLASPPGSSLLKKELMRPATCVFLKKCNASDLPALHGILTACFTEDRSKWSACMHTFFRHLIEPVNFCNPNCFVSIGKIHTCRGSSERICIQKISKQNRWGSGWGMKSWLSLSFLNCCVSDVKSFAEKTSERKSYRY